MDHMKFLGDTSRPLPPKREESSKTNVRRLLGPGAGRLSIHWLKFVIRNTAGIGLLTETQQLFILRILYEGQIFGL